MTQSIYLWELSDNAKALCHEADQAGWTAADAKNLKLLAQFIQAAKTKCPIEGQDKWYRLRRLLSENDTALQRFYRYGVIPQPERHTMKGKLPYVDVAHDLLMEWFRAGLDAGFNQQVLCAIIFYAQSMRYAIAEESNTAEVSE